MSIQDQIGKLEALLDRVRRNAAQPRMPANEPRAFADGAAPVPAVVAPVPAVAAPGPEPVEDDFPSMEVEPLSDDAIEELEELDDIVELKSDSPPAPGMDLDFEEEEAPASAPRAAASLDESSEGAYTGEAPIKTPPPESGRQEVSAQAESLEAEISGADAVDDLLEADLSGGPLSGPSRPAMPTMEQLGETVELEGADAPDADLELDEPVHVARPSKEDALEASLPGPAFQGAYDAALEVPPSARPGASAGAGAEPREAVQPVDLEVTARPPLSSEVHPIVVTPRRSAPVPDTFLGLLDQSLSLGR